MGYLADHPDELCVSDNDPATGKYIKRKPTPQEIANELADENNLEIVKDKHREIIQQAYCDAECENLDINLTGENVTYPGGYALAQIRDDALSLLIRTKARGWQPAEAKVTFYDVDGKPIYLTEDEADQVVLRTALKFESDHTKNELCKAAITDAVTVEQARAVVWP